MSRESQLEMGLRAFASPSWHDAYEGLSGAEGDGDLEPENLTKLATAAYLTGLDEESTRVWAKVHRRFLDRGNVKGAVRAAYWLAHGLLNRGVSARGAGWLRRAARLLEDLEEECVEVGYLLVPQGIRAVAEGRPDRAETIFRRAEEVGRRFSDPDLMIVARHGVGRAHIRQGDLEEGLSLLDGATIELEAARGTFEQLGAQPDVRRVSEVTEPVRRGPAHGLTGRELQVLRLVASGLTNRAIGERLSISERTVERHVSNIFGKLEVASRTEATAHAYEHGLI